LYTSDAAIQEVSMKMASNGRILTSLRGRWLKTYREAALKRAEKEEVE
jgi:hypothetical protein